jgi:hypothetical protein
MKVNIVSYFNQNKFVRLKPSTNETEKKWLFKWIWGDRDVLLSQYQTQQIHKIKYKGIFAYV